MGASPLPRLRHPRGVDSTPAFVDLGSADTIDRAVKDFVAAVGRAGRHIEASGFATAEADLRERADALYLLPFQAICDDSGRYLVERCHFSYLSASRDLIRYARPAPSAKHAPLILADPDFDLSPGTQVAVAAPEHTPQSTARSADLPHLTFSRVPGTRTEAQRVAKLLKPPNTTKRTTAS